MRHHGLKIAIVSDAVAPFHKGGKEERIGQLSAELSRRGHDVHLYTMKWWDGPSVIERDGLTYHALSPLYALYDAEGKRSTKASILFGMSCIKLARESFDVIDVDQMPYFPLFFAKIACLIKRKPMHTTWHEVWGADYWKAYAGSGVSTRIGSLVERMSVHLPDHILAVSAQTAQSLRAVLHYRGPITLVSNGVDWHHIQSLPASDERSDIVYVGRLISHKHVDVLIEAVGKLAAHLPGIRCTIIGRGPEKDNLAALIRERGLEQNVVILDNVESDDERLSRVKASRVFVSLSTREGFGITFLEAAAAGVPVVAVDHPDNAGRHLVTSDTGLLCPLDATAVAHAIARLMKDPVRPAETARAYDWKTATDELEKAFGARERSV